MSINVQILHEAATQTEHLTRRLLITVVMALNYVKICYLHSTHTHTKQAFGNCFSLNMLGGYFKFLFGMFGPFPT